MKYFHNFPRTQIVKMSNIWTFLNSLRKKNKSRCDDTFLGDQLDDNIYCYKIDSEDQNKMSRLHRAVWHGNLKKVKFLLQKKPKDVNTVDRFNRAPLHLAIAKDYYDIAWELLEHNANLDYVDCDGYTPFLKVTLTYIILW